MPTARLACAAALLGALATSTAAAHAGVTAPLSALASLPRPTALRIPETPVAVPGLTVASNDGARETRWHELKASTGRGYCIQTAEDGLSFNESTGATSRGSAMDFDLLRLVEKDGTATLERTRVHFDPPSAALTAMGRSSVELKEVARTPAGVVVWAYREGKNVVVLARNVDGGVESQKPSGDEFARPFVSAMGCPYGGARLDVRRPDAGAVAQITGKLAARGKGKDRVVPRFIIDASVSRVARDPEPLLAVRIRTHD